MAEINIFAIPVNQSNMGGDNLTTTRRDLSRRARDAGYHLINNFMSTSDLIDKVKNILDQDASHCLKHLEITGHGNPEVCDGIQPLTLSGFIRRYRDLRDQLCDETHLLLNGCNTGLKMRISGRMEDSLAEKIARGLPFDPANFNVHLTVWGLAGYGLQGTSSMERNMEVHAQIRRGRIRYGRYPGGRDAAGRNAWNSFRNW